MPLRVVICSVTTLLWRCEGQGTCGTQVNPRTATERRQRARRGGGGTSSAHIEQVRARLVVGLLHHQAGRAEENFDLGLRRVSAIRQKKTEIVR